jgi:hypothetical protein
VARVGLILAAGHFFDFSPHKAKNETRTDRIGSSLLPCLENSPTTDSFLRT